jgi:hypothetical protein
MALKYFTDISLEQNELIEASLQKVTQDPLGFVGQIIYNTAEQTFKYYNGSAWKGITGDYPTITEFAQEVQDRIDGDAALQGEIDTLSGTTAQLVIDLANEIQNRIDGDNTLQSNIDDVVVDLNNEIQNRADADSLLQDGVDANAQAIVNEYNARVLNDNILQDNIDNEEAARIAGDADLQSQIDSISENDTLDTVTTRGNTTTNDITVGSVSVTSGAETQFLKADGSLDATDYATSGELDAEALARSNADGTLQDNIDAEALARTNADGILQNNIDAEALARTNADTTLQNNIDAEALARTNADTTLQDNIDAEETARIAGDADLQSQIDGIGGDLSNYQLRSEKGQANGYASLDSGAKIPESQLPDSILGQLSYQGTWDASTDTPTLADPTTVKGDYYVVSVAGTYQSIDYAVGDWVISNGTSWEKVDNTDAVTSVFGRLGNVIANESDYSAFYPLISDLNQEVTDRTNADANLQSQIDSNDTDITALQTAVSDNDTDILNLQNNLSAEITDRTNADVTLQGNIDSEASTRANADVTLQGNIDSEASTRASADVTLQNNINAEETARIAGDANLQTQIDNLPSPNDATITLTAGDGLTGGGDFTTDQATNETITVSHADTSSQGDVTNTGLDFIQSVTLDGYGHVTGLTSATVTLPTVNDATITLSAGTGLTGGGDFTTDQATDETLTITHADTTRTNTTSSSTLSHEGTFTAITSVTTNSLGHVTGANTETYTLPSGAVPNNAVITLAAGTGLTGGGDFTTDQSNDETITFNATDVYDRFQAIASAGQTTIYADGTADTLTINGGSQIDVTTDASTDTLTIGHGNTSGLNGTYGSTSNSIKIDTITVDANGHITAITTGSTGDIDGVSAGTGLSGGGTSGSVTLSHGDTSSLSGTYGGFDPVINRNLYISSVSVDEFGHLTNVTTTTPEVFSLGDGITVLPQPPVGYDVALGLDYVAMSNFINSPSGSLTIQSTPTNTLEIDLNAPNGINTFYWMGGTNGQYLTMFNPRTTISPSVIPPAGIDLMFDVNPYLPVVMIDYDVNEGFNLGEDHLKFTSNLTGQYEFYGVNYNFFIDTEASASLSFPSAGAKIDYYTELITTSSPVTYGMQFQSNSSGQYKFFSPFGTGSGSASNLFVNTGSSFIETDGSQIGFGKSSGGNQYIPISIILAASTGGGPSGTGYIIADGFVNVFYDLNVSGSKNFRIDHPVHPDTHDLVHTVIESNRGDVVYRGKTKLVNGSASINIDSEVGMMTGTFEALTKDVQVFTTNEDGWTQVKGSVTGSTLNIIAQDTNCTDEVSWLIMGERNDKSYLESANTDENGRLILEPEETRTLEDRTNEIRNKS